LVPVQVNGLTTQVDYGCLAVQVQMQSARVVD